MASEGGPGPSRRPQQPVLRGPGGLSLSAMMEFSVVYEPQWKPYKFVKIMEDMTLSERALFQRFYDGSRSLSRYEYVCCLANLSMIEMGFVPVSSGQDPEIPANELMGLPMNERMNRLIDILGRLPGDGDHVDLSAVHYRCILPFEVPEGLLNNDEENNTQYVYSANSFLICTVHHGDTIIQCHDGIFQHTFKTNLAKNYLNGDFSNTIRHQLPVWVAVFDHYRFFGDIKCNVCQLLVDRYECIALEAIGFNQLLPNEMIVNVAKYLDMKSFVQLFQTSKRMHELLNTEEMWQVFFKRIPMDFAEYQLAVPSQATLSLHVANGLDNFRQNYVDIFLDAVLQRRRLHRNVLRHRNVAANQRLDLLDITL